MTSELNLSAATSYARNYSAGGHFGTFEAGFKIRNGHKTQDATENVYEGFPPVNRPADEFAQWRFREPGTITLAPIFGGKFGPVSDFNMAKNYVLANSQGNLDGDKTAAQPIPTSSTPSSASLPVMQ